MKKPTSGSSDLNQWFKPGAAIQKPTWYRIIQTVLSFKNEPLDEDDISRYQAEQFGLTVAEGGDVAVLELSAFAARSLSHDSPHRSRFLAARKQRLRELKRTKKPPIIVFYGTRNRRDYEDIAEVDLITGELARSDGSLCTLVYHPSAARYGLRYATDFVGLGKMLRQAVGPEGGTKRAGLGTHRRASGIQ
jgi:hypothetical protein